MKLDEKQKSFIGYLLSLAEEGQEDRGALAELRSGLGKDSGEMAQVHKHVVPYLPDHDYTLRWYYLTATLFGAYPEHNSGASLGKAFALMEDRSDSIDARFVALLNADSEDLGGHLRHAISLLKSKNQAIDWFQFFGDLLSWDDREGTVQLRWARHFYSNIQD